MQFQVLYDRLTVNDLFEISFLLLSAYLMLSLISMFLLAILPRTL